MLLPATVLAASMIKVGLGLPPPQIVGLHVVIVASIAVLAPLCFLVGASLTVAAKLPATGEARDIGVMYLFDALGAGLGGIVATWFAIQAFTAFQVSLMTAVLIFITNAAVLVRKPSSQVLTAFITLIAVVALWTAPGIEAWTAGHRWKGYHPIVDIDSKYSNLVVTQQGSEGGEEHTLFSDGVPQFSTPLPETYETEALLPLLMHPNPKSVLIIGGGLSGMLANWRSADLERIVYLQIDPKVVELERTTMASPEDMDDERLSIISEDAVSFSTDDRFDAVILAAGDPDTAAASRLYTEGFFKKVRRMLTPEGVLSFGVFKPAGAIGPEAAQMLGVMRATLGRAFDHVVVLPFETFRFVASRSDEYITDDPEVLRERLVERSLVAPVLEGNYLASIFPERIRETRDRIDEAAKGSPINTDLKPSAYFTGMLLWASRTGGKTLAWLSSLQRIKWPWLLALLLAAVGLSIVLERSGRRRRLHIPAFWMLFSIGFAAIVYEIVLLIYYQLQHGLLFYRIGIIITAFMVGLSLGAYASIRLFKRIRIKTAYLIAGIIAFAIYQPLLFYASSVSFVAANFACGLMEGFLFEATAEWMVAEREKIGHTAGWLGCADYWGSAAGSVVASILAVPLFGLVPSMFIAAALPLAAAAVMASSRI
jgi:spermidine synthase